MIRVFVYETTSADPLCADAQLTSQGRSMRDAMVADLRGLDGVRVNFAGRCDEAAAPSAAGSMPAMVERSVRQSARRVHQPPGETAVEFLRQQATQHDLVWVVAPESGGLLAALCDAVPEHQWIGSNRRAIRIAASKRATAWRLQAAGIPTTEPLASHQPCSGHSHRGSWIVKPDDGCGAVGARRHRAPESAFADFDRRRRRHEDAVMEPWVEGEPLSMALLCGVEEVEVLAVNRQHISSDAEGFLHFERVSPIALGEFGRQAMATLARRITAALPGLAGFVGVDVTWHPQRGPVVIEVNARVTCAYDGLSARLGCNVAERVLSQHRRRHGARLAPALPGVLSDALHGALPGGLHGALSGGFRDALPDAPPGAFSDAWRAATRNPSFRHRR